MTTEQSGALGDCLRSLLAQRHRNLEVLVAPYGARDAPGVGTLVSEHATADSRVLPAQDRREDLAGARDHGAERASGEYLAFVRAADTVPPRGFELLTAALEGSGSDLAIGRVARPQDTAARRRLSDRLHAQALVRATLDDCPWAVADAAVEGMLFRREFWRREALAFGHDDGLALCVTAVEAVVRASGFDVIREVALRRPRPGDAVAFGHLSSRLPRLPRWREDVRAAISVLHGRASPAVLDWWRAGLVETDVVGLTEDVERMDDADWASFRQALREILGDRAPESLAGLSAESRVRAWLVRHDRRDELEELVASRWFVSGFPTAVREGRVYARLPHAGDEALGVPEACFLLHEDETPLVTSVYRARRDHDAVRLELFAFVRYVDLRGTVPRAAVALVDTASGERTGLAVEVGSDPGVNRFAGDRDQDYSHGVLRVDVPAALLEGGVAAELEVTLTVAGLTRTGALGRRELAAALAAVSARPPVEGPALVVDDVAVRGGALWVNGGWTGTPPADPVVRLESGSVAAAGVLSAESGRVRCRFPLRQSRWSLAPTPLPSGRYRIALDGAGGRDQAVRCRVVPSPELAGRLPVEQPTSEHGVQVQRATGGDLAVRLSAPLRDDEVGAFAQHSLQTWFRGQDGGLDEHSAYFQAYTGESATDSPLAIHQELVRRRPDLVLHWGVADSSARVPEGAVPVLIRSREWYAVLARSKYVVSNINLDRWFCRRPGQEVLQTFHGYPAKTMGLGLWRAKQFTPRRLAIELARSSGQWTTILTPVPEMDQHYRREYDYRGRILSQGYPRDDVLVSPAAPGVRAAAREGLGIAEGQTAILYAPTWRDDLATNYRRAESADLLDVGRLVAALGPEYVVLLRGHRFHPRAESQPGGSLVLDVSDYPEINDLILAADAAVLDYSSLRFDFALTGKPMLFLVPDLAEYRDSVRGFLFDFEDSAPGPHLASTEEVVACLRDLDGVRAAHAGDVARFTAKYQYTQDGRAAERVVRAFFGTDCDL